MRYFGQLQRLQTTKKDFDMASSNSRVIKVGNVPKRLRVVGDKTSRHSIICTLVLVRIFLAFSIQHTGIVLHVRSLGPPRYN